jgi:tetratricopeptide (TPR) repeat protein
VCKLGRYEEALADFETALEIKPHSSGTYFSKASYHLAQNQVDLALSCLQRAIALNPNHRDNVKSDPDFVPVLGDQRFQALLFE